MKSTLEIPFLLGCKSIKDVCSQGEGLSSADKGRGSSDADVRTFKAKTCFYGVSARTRVVEPVRKFFGKGETGQFS